MIKIKNYTQMFPIYMETGWWLALEFLDFLELLLDFFVLVKSLKKGFLNKIFLKFSQFFFLLCSIFSHILLFLIWMPKLDVPKISIPLFKRTENTTCNSPPKLIFFTICQINSWQNYDFVACDFIIDNE